ncbi:MAG TPA: hypothetical protein VHD56_16290 [Tepidisphaeraceae bacterium]|nr:hypothetical protein [Tepidisphaeraceae bacterium]
MLTLIVLGATFAYADFPKPSPYPITWELKFEHSLPKRVTVQVGNSSVPQAYWYMTYTVTNKTDKEQMFLPVFEMMTRDGQVIRSDKNIPASVFAVIKGREKKQFLEPFPTIAGELRVGEDQAKDGVAIWPEPMAKMGQFSIFCGGLSGEAVILKNDKGEQMKDANGQLIIVRKTLQINFSIRGDDMHPGEDEVNETGTEWVMR